MIKVTVKENESIDKALKRFKKKLEKSGTLKEFRNRQFFLKPSRERRTEMSRAKYRQKFLEQSR